MVRSPSFLCGPSFPQAAPFRRDSFLVHSELLQRLDLSRMKDQKKSVGTGTKGSADRKALGRAEMSTAATRHFDVRPALNPRLAPLQKGGALFGIGISQLIFNQCRSAATAPSLA